jgi:hypothetical protein
MIFFAQLYKYNRWLFGFIVAFCILTVFINLTKVETTPFFIWGMYSEKEQNADKYEILEVVVNDSVRVDYSSSFTDANRFYLLSPLTYSRQIEGNNGVDPEESFIREKSGKYFSYIEPYKKNIFNDSLDMPAFQNWYKRYLEGTLHLKVIKLQLNLLELVYSHEGIPELKKKTPIASWNH